MHVKCLLIYIYIYLYGDLTGFEESDLHSCARTTMTSSADEVDVALDDGSSLRVHLHGGTVLSWKHKGKEVLFLSKQAVFNNKKAIRGGIPVVFPCFGPWDLGPQHGFARTSRWTLESKDDKPSDGAVKIVLSLVDNEDTRKMWQDNKFKITYTLTLTENEFTMDFDVKNNGDNTFSFTALLHTYLGVEDVTKTTVSGLKGLEYVDKVKGGTHTEDRELVSLAENYDRVYANTPNEHLVKDGASGRTVAVRKTNFPDTVVWNPWSDKAKGMSDFGDDEYIDMLCVEAGHVSSPVNLPAGDTFHAKQVLAIVQ